jgi:hypothetical protein
MFFKNVSHNTLSVSGCVDRRPKVLDKNIFAGGFKIVAK